jgi:Ring finger domain
MSHNAFIHVEVEGKLVNVDAVNVDDIDDRSGSANVFAYISCDSEAYNGNFDASDVFRIAVNQPRANIIILYSEISDHCTVQGLDTAPAINGILTTTEAMAATMLAGLGLTEDSQGSVTILPDLNAYTNSSNEDNFTNGFGQASTTAVAMIILYSITGIITALFVVIIVTGAVRAHRHPERYGPRTIIGRGRQSRARGIARAMLDTLPIVKFGDRDAPNTAKDPTRADIEMTPGTTDGQADSQPRSDAVPPAAPATDAVAASEDETATSPANADGTDQEGQLGCSICTEDFIKGEDIRVLPCNHKFHPGCVDPWLLNVSGTCPLCRIDLRPAAEEGEGADGTSSAADGELPPPLAGERRDSAAGLAHDGGPSSLRRDTIAQLRRMAALPHEDRIVALRRYMQERDRRGDGQEDEGERRGLARRLRERFRVRTERRGAVEDVEPNRRRNSIPRL